MKIVNRITAASALLLLILFCSFSSKEPMNVVDAAGKRQGHWVITAAMMRMESVEPARIIQEGTYADSKRIGEWITYYTNGSVRNKINYVNDKPEGMAFYYSTDGTLSCEIPFVNGVRSGTGKLYYPSGTVKMEMTWNNGRIDGPAKTFYPNGKVCEEGTWRFNYWQE